MSIFIFVAFFVLMLLWGAIFALKEEKKLSKSKNKEKKEDGLFAPIPRKKFYLGESQRIYERRTREIREELLREAERLKKEASFLREEAKKELEKLSHQRETPEVVLKIRSYEEKLRGANFIEAQANEALFNMRASSDFSKSAMSRAEKEVRLWEVELIKSGEKVFVEIVQEPSSWKEKVITGSAYEWDRIEKWGVLFRGMPCVLHIKWRAKLQEGPEIASRSMDHYGGKVEVVTRKCRPTGSFYEPEVFSIEMGCQISDSDLRKFCSRP